MSSTYVPPHMRKRVHNTEKKEEKILTPDNFPALSGSALVRSDALNWSKTKTSFAALARDWSDQSEHEKQQREIQEARERARIERENMEKRLHFSYSGQFDGVESDYELPEEHEIQQVDDEWNVVDRKKYKPELTIEEKLAKQERLEKEEQQQKEYEESVWATEQWDYRDRRSYI